MIAFFVIFVVLAAACSAQESPESTEDPCGFIRLIARDGWGAANPRGNLKPLQGAAKYVIVEPTGTSKQSRDAMVETQRNAMQRGEPDIDFNYVVGDDNVSYEGRGSKAAYSNANTVTAANGIKIGILGASDDLPLPRTWATVLNLVNCMVKSGAVAADYEVRVDQQRNTCDQSLSKRFQQILEHHVANGVPPPKFNCVN